MLESALEADRVQTTHPQAPEPGHALEVAAGIRWTRMPLPFALDHVNLWLLQDGDGWTAVDTGLGWEPARAAWRALLDGHPLQRLVVTHLHPDHLGLAAWLGEATGAATWMTAAERERAQQWYDGGPGYGTEDLCAALAGHGLAGPGLEGLRRQGNTYRRGVDGLPAAIRAIRDGESIEIGGLRWRVISGAGHSPDHASLYCAEARVLISGDMLLPRITTNISAHAVPPGEDALGRYLDSLERFAGLPADTLVLPSHGLPFRGLHTRIGQLRDHHARRCDLLLAACGEGPRDAAALLPVLFERNIDDPFQTLFAMGECVAHLVHLERRGLLEQQDRGGIVRFAAR